MALSRAVIVKYYNKGTERTLMHALIDRYENALLYRKWIMHLVYLYTFSE